MNAPEQFARFKNEVIRFEINEGRLASDLNKYAKMYSNIDNINDLTEEMAANAAEALLKSDDFIVDLMSDKKFVQSMAQESPSIAKKIFNKLQELIDAIRDFLKHSDVEHDIAKAISKDAQTLETIRGLWLDAFKTAIHNRAVQHENTNSPEKSADNKSSGIKYSTSESFEEQVDKVLNNTFDRTNHVYMGETPDILVNILGIPKLPMLMTYNHVYSVVVSERQAKTEHRYSERTNYHNLGDIKLKSIPDEMQNPAMIIKSNNDNNNCDFVVVTDQTDKSNNRIIAAVKVKGIGYLDNNEISANIVLSVYGKESFNNYLKTAYDENRILYINKNSQLQNIPGVQFANNILSTDYSNSISHYKQIVNSYLRKNFNQNSAVGKKFSITENMTEEERYNELKDKTISPAHPNMSRVANIDVESYSTLRAKDAKKPIRQLAQMLGIHNVNYSNSNIDFEFGFSSNSLKTSLNHQQEYGGDYADYAKMLTCLDELVNNAELIEVHKDYKNNADLNKTYVLFSAYAEGNIISPVQFEVKEYYSAEEKLYLSIVLTKIEKSAVVNESHVENSIASPRLVADLNISISQLFANVNTSDAKFLKYVPDQFLSDKQIDAKRQAQKIDYEKYGRYKELFEPSTRFSIPEQTDGEYETLLHENEQLHEQVKALRAEMKLTQGHKVRPEAVAKLARRLKKEYSSNIDADDLAKRLEDVFNYVASDDAIANIAHEVMYAIAGDIINNSQRLNTDLRDEYNELRDLIRRTTIFVSDSMKSEIEHQYGDYNSFRKSMFGKLKLSTKVGIDKKGTYIDSFYQDLTAAAPEWFDEVAEQDMLPRIADFLNATDAYMENPYEQDTEQYISDLAQEIFNQYFETPNMKIGAIFL